MYFLAMLNDLPFSILFTSLVLAVSALPVHTTELNQANFDTTAGKGLWFIEHYSPYCGHCKQFKPTWDKLVEEAEKEIPTVKLATVDCTTQGDLCEKHDIHAYPSMKMFEEGKIVGEFKGARELDKLKDFIKAFVKPPPSSSKPPAAKPKQPPPKLNPNGEVLELTNNIFSSTLAKGPAFVKFYAPWCGHCKRLAPVWKQLAGRLRDKLTVAEVNCDDHGALCKANNIQGYPSLVYFNNGAKSEYNGGRKLEQLKAFAEKAASAGIQVLEKPEDLNQHIEKEDVVYLLLHSATDTDVVNHVREASSPLLGSPTIYASSSPALWTRFSVPSSVPWAIIVLKDHDTLLPSTRLEGSSDLSSEDLRSWLLTHRLPTTLELTQDTFQGVMNAPQAPLVVIAVSSIRTHERVAQRLRDIAKKWRVRTEGSGLTHGREVIWAFMDGERWKQWMKSMYSIDTTESKDKDGHEGENDGDRDKHALDDVKVVIADHNKLVYYDTNEQDQPIQFMSSASLFGSVEDAASGKTKFKHSETATERVARYLNGHLESLEAFLIAKPWHAVFFVIGFLGLLIWVIAKVIGNDTAQMDFRDYKGKNGRLD